jgi:ribonuclease-3
MPLQKNHIMELEKELGHVFIDKQLLEAALTHKSYFHEHKNAVYGYNERLEFLGDAVIGLVVVECLFRLRQQYSESVLAKMKSYLVSEGVLADMAFSISLGVYVRLGRGEEATGGRKKKSILSDAFEAVIGAVFIDAGYEKTKKTLLSFLDPVINTVLSTADLYDYKTELQEKSQLHYGVLPDYRLIREDGAEHERIFTVAVFIDGKKRGVGTGKRKKEAESQAARKALEQLKS